MELINQYYGWLDESTKSAITREDLVFSIVGIFLLGCVFVIGYYALSGFISWVCGNKD